MKKAYPILAAILIATVLASGCTQQPGGTGTTNGNGNTGPAPFIPSQPALQIGSWATVAMTTTSARPIEFTYSYVEKSINGAAYTGIETETDSGVTLILWEKGKEAGASGTKMYSLAKFGQLTLCNAIETAPQGMPSTENPYASNNQGVTSLGEGSYTTPTGKTVSVVKYRVAASGSTGEYWYSSQVPFPLAWSEANSTVAGKDVTSKMELQDFGTGATSSFTDEDFGKCS